MGIKSMVKGALRPFSRPVMNHMRMIVREEMEAAYQHNDESFRNLQRIAGEREALLKRLLSEKHLREDNLWLRLAELERQVEVHKKSSVPINCFCEICGETNFSLLFDRERNGEDVRNYVCEECGFVFIYPRPTENELIQLYKESGFSSVARGSAVPDDRKFYECEQSAIARYSDFKKQLSHACLDVSKIKGASLDVGTGAGSFVYTLLCDGWEAEGLEPDTAYAEKSEEHYNILIHKTPLEDFKHACKYHLVTAFNVLEHVLYPARFIKLMRELLVEEGILYIDLPGLDKMHTEIDRFFWKPHINTFSLSSLRHLLSRCGLKPIYLGYNSLGFLTAIAQKGTVPCKGDEPQFSNVYRVKSIVDSAYSPMNRNAETLFVYPKLGKPLLRLVHIGVHTNTNAGDTLLFPVVRLFLQKYLAPIAFTLVNVRDAVTQETIDLINSHDGVVIGGGGLFLKDTNYNQVSGWQWACPEAMLKKISVPIVLFAVGYNRFRGQEEFDDVFARNINLLASKSAFFSLRNHGSIETLKNYLDPSMHSKLVFQPCPTTLLAKFYPLPSVKTTIPKDRKILAVNIPFDRSAMRYSQQEPRIFQPIAEAIKSISQDNWRVVLYNNMTNIDQEAAAWLLKFGVDLPQLNLEGMPPDKVVHWYAHADAVIGGRGHSQMIPFGLNTPIFSLISHNKMRYFLEDINHPEWGDEILSPSLKDNLLHFMNSTKDPNLSKELSEAQDVLWQLSMNNIARLKEVFKL